MDLSGIISISGKPGLFKVVAQAKNNIIVESLVDGKRVPAYSTDRISALEDISIYTYEEDKPLAEVYQAIYEKEKGGAILSHKESLNKLTKYLLEVSPNYDEDRVYSSDIKKLFQWYNILHKADALKVEEKVEEKKASAKKTAKKDSEEKETKKAPAKKASDKKAAPKKKPAAKKAAPKTSTKKTTSTKSSATKKK
jgi:hypothetical protein